MLDKIKKTLSNAIFEEEINNNPIIEEKITDKKDNEQQIKLNNNNNNNNNNNKDIYKMLKSVIYTGDSPLIKFIDMLDSLKDTIPNDETRNIVAIKALEKFGISRSDIISECSLKNNQLISEKDKFEKTLLCHISDIDLHKKSIESITSKIIDLETEKTNITNKIKDEESKVVMLKSQFYESFDIINKELSNIKETIDKYLGGNK